MPPSWFSPPQARGLRVGRRPDGQGQGQCEASTDGEVCIGVIHSSLPACGRAWRQRPWTETSAGRGRCKSRTSSHRVRHGGRLLRPRSFRRWGLWSRFSFLSWSCSFLGCCYCLLISVFQPRSARALTSCSGAHRVSLRFDALHQIVPGLDERLGSLLLALFGLLRGVE